MTPNTTPNIIKERKIQMLKWDKLIARICNLSKDLRFTQLQKVLETYRYRMDAPRVEVVIIHLENKGKVQLQYQSMNQLKKYM